MVAQTEALESEKQILEKMNASVIEENRNLLEQLESLNSALSESDAQVTNLQSVLQSTQQELYKLSHLAARTESLERQLADFEREQAIWHKDLQLKEESEKSALRRWQEAERTLTNLQDQIDQIEREAKEERERHSEVVGRMERRHAVERELDSAAGRLKGAAATKNSGHDANGTNVVSHFVKDILQDNANLQMGIVELRDMLQNSNEEVEDLRKQLTIHQPIGEEIENMTPLAPPRPHLQNEMRAATAQELHVHHHYHAPTSAPKPAQIKRPKKKRYAGFVPGHYPTHSGSSTPRSSFSHGMPSSAITILQQTAASLPEQMPVDNRWSIQSRQTIYPASSGPSSPRSNHRASSVFDRVFSDAGQDSSRPTTPDTEDPGSPPFNPINMKRSSGSSFHSLARPSTHRNRPSLDSILDVSIENLHHFDQRPGKQAAIPEEENEPSWEEASSITGEEGRSNDTSPPCEDIFQDLQPRTIRRAASHESLLSVSGMDVHTLKNRPSQLLASYTGRAFTTEAIVSDTNAHAARPVVAPGRSSSGHSILSDMATEHGVLGGAKQQGFGKRVGGWVWGRWGVSPALKVSSPAPPSNNKPTSTASIASSSTGQSNDDSQITPKKPIHRPPGINQSGPIVGFGPEMKISHPPILGSLDQDALKNVLEEV